MYLTVTNNSKLSRDEQQLRRALHVLQRTRGPLHKDTIDTLFRLAKATASSGKIALALEFVLQVVKLRKASLGADHRDVAVAMDYLAGMYFSRAGGGLLAQAWYSQARAVYKQMRSPTAAERVEQSCVTNNLGMACMATWSLNLAETLFREALTIQVDELGEDHLTTAKTMHNLADVLGHKQQLAEAESQLRSQ